MTRRRDGKEICQLRAGDLFSPAPVPPLVVAALIGDPGCLLRACAAKTVISAASPAEETTAGLYISL